jgi:transcriptional repressor NrdR
MKCPFCSHIEDKVIDSRLSKDGDAIRRRRECLKCEGRFTSYERIEEILPLVIKKDGRREPFDRQKIMHGLEKAFEKRPIGAWIGEEIMSLLKGVDEVAYVRFASVYRQFKDIKEFMEEVKGLFTDKKISKKFTSD